MLKKGAKIREIAEEIGVSERTIYREKKRGMVKGLLNSDLTTRDEYDYQYAQSKYETAQKNKQRDLKIGKNIKLSMYLEKAIIKEKYSPYAALEKAKREGLNPNICLKTLYNYILCSGLIFIAFFSTIVKKPIFNLFASYIAVFIVLKNYSNDLVDKIFKALYICAILLISELIIANILGYTNIIPTNNIKMKKSIDLFIMHFFIYIVAIFLSKSKKIKNSSIDSLTKNHLLIVPILSIVLLIFVYSFDTINPFQISIFTILLYFINITTYKVYTNTIKALTFEKEQEIIEEQNNFYKNQLELMKENEKLIKSNRHDLKNHIAVLNSLILENENSKAKEYLDELYNNFFEEKKYFSTGNDIIDAIVNYKLNSIEEEKIDFNFNADISSTTNSYISSYDMTVILGNLIDNAIEACKKLDDCEKKIILKIKDNKGKLSIYVQNKFDGNIQIRYDQIVTTKENKIEHGYGIKNIKRVVENNKGIFNFEIIDGNIFTALIVLFIVD